ncbi:MAG: DNA-deoxyinosine glycosylase [Burkholderiaceae bacterium]
MLATTQAMLTGFEPVVDENCRVLVLGSFPGEASLRAGHYYAHRSNQFWPIVSMALDEDLSLLSFEQRYERLLARRIGLWDVISRCRRQGSLDASIRDAWPSALDQLLVRLPELRRVLLNGATAARGAQRIQWPARIELSRMPSTSAAFAAMPTPEKAGRWVRALRAALLPQSQFLETS